MSLLMDALKKAELAKRNAEAENSAPAKASAESPSPPSRTENAAPESIAFETQPSARPPSPAPPKENPLHPDATASSLPPLPVSLELLDEKHLATPAGKSGHQAEPVQATTPAADLLSLQNIGVTHDRRRHNRQIGQATTETARARNDTEDATGRKAIQNLFQTKQAPAASRNFTFAIVASIATIVGAAAIGWYFWSELQPKSGLLAGPALNINRPPPALIPQAAPVAGEPAIPGLTPPAVSPENIAALPPVRDIAKAQPRLPIAAPANKLFQLSKAAAPQIDPSLERGYSALNQGDTAVAKTAYAQALGNDPRNIDALSGMAVLAQRAGNLDQAADYYRRLIEADPHNAFALAGLIGLHTQMNPAEAEMRLKQALSTQPDSAPLNFSLGNLCAAAKRWPEAQQAYFRAVTADPGNPDYLFNLAVSLDQLRQPRLAASYYAQALAAARSRPASFNQAMANERLRQLPQ